MIKICRVCKELYEYRKREQYEGKSPVRCPIHQKQYKQNQFKLFARRTHYLSSNRRKMGHSTRNQHKPRVT